MVLLATKGLLPSLGIHILFPVFLTSLKYEILASSPEKLFANCLLIFGKHFYQFLSIALHFLVMFSSEVEFPEDITWSFFFTIYSSARACE